MIEERRLQLGLTKSEAARLAGVSRGTWHEVESGKRVNMLADTLNLFDKALGYERGTLRQAGRPKPPPGSPVQVQYLGNGPPDEDMKLRFHLIQLAMTMTSDEVRNVMMLLLVDHRHNDLAEEIRRLVRAELTQQNERENQGDRPATERTDSDATREHEPAGAG